MDPTQVLYLDKLFDFWNRSTENKLIVSVGSVIALLLPCAFCFVIFALALPPPTPPAAPAIQPAPVNAPALPSPTNTPLPPPPEPTPTPVPTETPLPLPTSTPLPPTPTIQPTSTTDPLSPQAREYGIEVGTIAELYAEALFNLSDLMIDPLIGDDDWATEVAFNIAVISELENLVIALNPPPDMQHIHNEFLQAASDCSTSMDFLVEGLDNLDVDSLNNAAAFMTSCGDRIRRATELADEYLTAKGL